MPGPMREPRGAKPKIENPGKLFGRLMGYVLKNYTPHIVVVVICIFVGVFSNIQGTLFMQTLIDNYIVPLLGTDNPDFSGLANAITRVACFYAIGAASSYLYNRIMINVSQALCAISEMICFIKWNHCQLNILIRMRMVILCHVTPMILIH